MFGVLVCFLRFLAGSDFFLNAFKTFGLIDRQCFELVRLMLQFFLENPFLVLVVCVFWGWFCLLCFGVRDSLTLCHGKDHCHCIKFLCVYNKKPT